MQKFLQKSPKIPFLQPGPDVRLDLQELQDIMDQPGRLIL